MARKSERSDDFDGSDSIVGKTLETGNKELLNRREYLKIGAAATTVLGAGASLSAATTTDANSFVTDFSEYAQ